MAGELERRHGADLFRGPGARQWNQEIRDTYRVAATAEAQINNVFRTGKQVIDRTAELIEYRAQRVGNDQIMFGATAPLMAMCVQQMLAAQHNLGANYFGNGGLG